PLERRDAVGPEDLEERQLRLHGDAVRRDRVDDPAAEAGGRLGRGRAADVRVPAELEREQVEPRVEADDELAPPLADRLGQTVGEGRGRDRSPRVHHLQTNHGPPARPGGLPEESAIKSARGRATAILRGPWLDSEEVRAS